MFYLHVGLKFHYILGRWDENVMAWIPDAALGYVLEQFLPVSAYLMHKDEFLSGGCNR